MNTSNDLHVFYTLPIPIDRSPYIEWHQVPRLRRYIQQLRGNGVDEILPYLLERLQQVSDRDPTLLDLYGCHSAVLAQMLLLNQRGLWLKFDLFDKLQRYGGSSLEMGDVYGIALVIISHPASFLSNFTLEPRESLSRRLEIWSREKLRRCLVDEIRKLPGLRHFKRTNLGLLARSSERRVRASSIADGQVAGKNLEVLLTIHTSLVETTQAKTFDTQDPQDVHYAALSARYHYYADRTGLPTLDRAQLQQLLSNMGRALRNYEQPPIDSLDRVIGNDTENSGTRLGDLIGDATAAELSSIEERAAAAETYRQFVDLLRQLPPESEQILILTYGLKLTQKEAGEEIDCNQTTIMRRQNRLFQKIVPELIVPRWDGTITAIDLNGIVTIVGEICSDYYPQILARLLDEIPTNHPADRVAQFIAAIEHRWQFTFNPQGVGITKAGELFNSLA